MSKVVIIMGSRTDPVHSKKVSGVLKEYQQEKQEDIERHDSEVIQNG